MKSETTTSLIDSRMKSDRSMLISRAVPGGSSERNRSSSARTPFATSSVLALEICSMPMLTPGTPFERERLRSFSAARRTSATSPSRTRYPSGPRPITRLRKSCSVLSPVSVRSVSSRCEDSSRPAGSWTFSRRNAFSMSMTVSCRAASACRSIQTRIA